MPAQQGERHLSGIATNLAAMLGDREGAGRSSAGRTEDKENGTGHTLLTGTGDKPWVFVKNESGTRYLEHITARLYKSRLSPCRDSPCTRPCLRAAVLGPPLPRGHLSARPGPGGAVTAAAPPRFTTAGGGCAAGPAAEQPASALRQLGPAVGSAEGPRAGRRPW